MEMQVTDASPADIGRLTTGGIWFSHTNEVVFVAETLLLCKTGGNGRTRDAANLYPARRIDAT